MPTTAAPYRTDQRRRPSVTEIHQNRSARTRNAVAAAYIRLSCAQRDVPGSATATRPAKTAVRVSVARRMDATRAATATAIETSEGMRIQTGSEEIAAQGLVSRYQGPGAGSTETMS